MRSLYLALGDRLGHDVFFPDASFCAWANERSKVGTWLTPNIAAAGGIPTEHLREDGNLRDICSREQFMDWRWDAIIMTRSESESVFHQLLASHPHGVSIKRIGQAGNECQGYDWGTVPNFLSSDYLSFVRCPDSVNKLHYMQELGRQFCPDKFTYLTEEDLLTINTFINCLDSFGPWQWDKEMPSWHGVCPHCDTAAKPAGSVTIRDLWTTMKSHLPEYRLRDFGINNTHGMIAEKDLPEKILSGALTWGYKTYEGFGHSLAQSVSMGRLCLVPRRFHRYRTANQFLVPNLTCFECEWTPESIISTVRWFTSSLVRANAYSEACFNAARGIFNWQLDAFRLEEFLENLR